MRVSHSPVYRPTYAEVFLPHVEANAKWLQKISNGFFCPMVKSNAYGHGDVEIVRRLSAAGIKTMGVALIEEALRLRQSGCQHEDILMFGCFDAIGAEQILAQRMTPVIKLKTELASLQDRLAPGQRWPIHLKFNTGMARLGFEASEARDILRLCNKDQKFEIRGICSHLSHGEDGARSQGHSAQQAEALVHLQSIYGDQPAYHLYNSSGALSLWAHDKTPEIKFGFRPGLSLYGVSPEIEFMTDDAKQKWPSLPLKPVMKLCSAVVSYRQVKTGDTVSYGGRWSAPCPSWIGVIPIGYADGFSRHFSNSGQVLFRGHRVPVVGTVCMDYTLIDLTQVLKEGPGSFGEEVVLIGRQGEEELGASEVASWAGTISYEMLTCVGRRVPRRYID